ncbi:MAG: hypothetical protein LKF58_00145 [Bacilli bacterium]|jgi:Sec-independent protein translocase protein TatA|nr:hypothetical protein [Bacilli bacterium]MCH4210179.1 hypothetical protein [Bacilli bacterium]MCH4277818.1 hypothetical protein [Bacilli bacterium]
MDENETKVEAEEVKKPKKPRKTPDLNKGGLIWTIWNFTEAALLVVAGVLAIVFSDNASLQSAILPVIGSFLIVGGLLRILMNFMPIIATSRLEAAAKIKAKSDLAYDMVIGGSFELALGVTLITIYVKDASAFSTFISLISNFLGIILIVAGASFLIFAIGFIIAKLYKIYMPILEIILAAALIALGVVVIIYMNGGNNVELFNKIVLIIAGIVLILIGLAKLVETIKTVNKVRKAKKFVKEAAAVHDIVHDAVTPTIDVTTEEGKDVTPDETPVDEPKEDK